jgi:transposase
LRKRRAPGRPSRLKPDQLQAVADIYRTGPLTAGFKTDTWTTVRFAEAIFVRFGIRYDPDHVGRIMHRLGLRAQTRAPRRTDDSIDTSLYPPNAIMTRPEISPTLS